METRYCSRGKHYRPIKDFNKSSTRREGVQWYCRDCFNAFRREIYRRKSKQENARIAAYRKTKKGKKVVAKINKNARKKHRFKHIARIAVREAIRKGELVRGSCEKCGKKKTHGHHDDYSKPLDVRWLCQKHHVAVHNELREQNRTALLTQPPEGEQK